MNGVINPNNGVIQNQVVSNHVPNLFIQPIQSCRNGMFNRNNNTTTQIATKDDKDHNLFRTFIIHFNWIEIVKQMKRNKIKVRDAIWKIDVNRCYNH